MAEFNGKGYSKEFIKQLWKESEKGKSIPWEEVEEEIMNS